MKKHTKHILSIFEKEGQIEHSIYRVRINFWLNEISLEQNGSGITFANNIVELESEISHLYGPPVYIQMFEEFDFECTHTRFGVKCLRREMQQSLILRRSSRNFHILSEYAII